MWLMEISYNPFPAQVVTAGASRVDTYLVADFIKSDDGAIAFRQEVV